MLGIELVVSILGRVNDCLDLVGCLKDGLKTIKNVGIVTKDSYDITKGAIETEKGISETQEKKNKMSYLQNEKKEMLILDSKFPILNFIVIVVFVPFVFYFILITQLKGLSKQESIIVYLIIFGLVFSVASYFLLYRVRIYLNDVKVTYFIKHSFGREKIIHNQNIFFVQYEYISGKGVSNNLTICYKENGVQKKIKFPSPLLTKKSYANALKNFKNNSIQIEISPSNALEDFM